MICSRNEIKPIDFSPSCSVSEPSNTGYDERLTQLHFVYVAVVDANTQATVFYQRAPLVSSTWIPSCGPSRFVVCRNSPLNCSSKQSRVIVTNLSNRDAYIAREIRAIFVWTSLDRTTYWLHGPRNCTRFRDWPFSSEAREGNWARIILLRARRIADLPQTLNNSALIR